VVGWFVKPRMTTELVTDALAMAWFRRRPAPGALHHSDRGSQYASHDFQRKLAAYGMCCSMSRKGNCWDTQCLPESLDGLPIEFPRGWGSTRLNLIFKLNHGSVTN